MPSLSQITANFFLGVINRLGVRPPPSEAFLLSNVVQPVSIVDSDVALAAVATSQLLDTPFTAGRLVAPAANTVLADTGPQPAGNYLIFLMLTVTDGAGVNEFALERRNAANSANIWSHFFLTQGGAVSIVPLNLLFTFRIVLNLNERFRIENTTALSAGSPVQASIWLLPS
jgi:hypothetical protein